MKKILFAFLLSTVFIACDNTKEVDPENLNTAVLESYSKLVYTNYEESLADAINLKISIDAFITQPSQAGLDRIKTDWLKARRTYGQTEAFRFYGGPIDDVNGPEGLINGWPLDESYIDYVVGNSDAGIINNADEYPTINKQVLIDANENGSETNLSTGYHAIEFLVWGQDLSENGPGNRPFSDYTTAPNANRRKLYLQTAADLLVENLTYLVNSWTVNAPYRTAFVAGGDESLKAIFRGIGTLAKGELAGERMTVALENADQEDEHSCFSDNTHVDIEMNYLGIANVYQGQYLSANGELFSGPSLSDLVKAKSAEKDQTILSFISESKTHIAGIPIPFDNAIRANDSSGNIEKSIISLRKLSDALVDGALSIGLQVNTDLD